MRTVDDYAIDLLDNLTTLSAVLTTDHVVDRDELLRAVVYRAQERQAQINTLLTHTLQDIDAILSTREEATATEGES